MAGIDGRGVPLAARSGHLFSNTLCLRRYGLEENFPEFAKNQ
jgi:hypothetical protein